MRYTGMDADLLQDSAVCALLSAQAGTGHGEAVEAAVGELPALKKRDGKRRLVSFGFVVPSGHITRHSRMGRKMAGTRFITLILVRPSMFKDSATISKEPTQVISAMTASPR